MGCVSGKLAQEDISSLKQLTLSPALEQTDGETDHLKTYFEKESETQEKVTEKVIREGVVCSCPTLTLRGKACLKSWTTS